MIEKDKQILEHYIMNLSNPIKKEKSIDIKRENIVKSIFNMKLFPLRKVLSSIKRDPLKKVLSVFFRDEVDEALAYDKIYEEVKDRIRKFNGEIIDLHRDEFDGWKEELKNGLDSRLSDMNPILQKFTIEIQKLEGKIEQLETQRKRLNNEQLELNNLMEVRK